MLSEKFGQRFTELQIQSDAITFEKSADFSDDYVDYGLWEQWATSAQNLIKSALGEISPHYVNFATNVERCTGGEREVKALQAIFRSAKEDFEGGYVFNVDLRVSGEVFGDFIALAKRALTEGHKDVAAVLASAALEDALKRYAVSEGLSVNEKNMTEVINALKSKGLVSGARKSILGAMPRVRDFAMHAEWDKISESDVNSVIGFVEKFLLSSFSDG